MQFFVQYGHGVYSDNRDLGGDLEYEYVNESESYDSLDAAVARFRVLVEQDVDNLVLSV